MKITYRFLDGAVSEVEVSDEIGEFIIASRREEASRNRRERRHSYSLEAIRYESGEYGTPDFTETLFDDTADRIHEAFRCLTKTQQHRLLRLAALKRISRVADAEHRNYASVYESIQGARKKFLENFRIEPHKTASEMSVWQRGGESASKEGESKNE